MKPKTKQISQIAVYSIFVSSISGWPVKSTPLAATANVSEDENSQIIIKSNQPLTTAPMADHIYTSSFVSSNPSMTVKMDAITEIQSLKRVKRRVVQRPLFVYRRFHQQTRANKPVRDNDEDEREDEPKTNDNNGHEHLRRQNRNQNQQDSEDDRKENEEIRQTYEANRQVYKENLQTYEANLQAYEANRQASYGEKRQNDNNNHAYSREFPINSDTYSYHNQYHNRYHNHHNSPTSYRYYV